jgi:hypothetical protein
MQAQASRMEQQAVQLEASVAQMRTPRSASCPLANRRSALAGGNATGQAEVIPKPVLGTKSDIGTNLRQTCRLITARDHFPAAAKLLRP